MEELIQAILNGNQSLSLQCAQKLKQTGISNNIIITDGIEKAMEQLDAKCTVEQFNLLEIMLSGRAVMAVMKELYPEGRHTESNKGTIVLATLEGDVHDLGKNIFKMVLTAKGYKVVDCGKDCPIELLVDTAIKAATDFIGISGLITSIIPKVKLVRPMLAEKNLEHITILAGGAALKQSNADNLNVDYIAQDTFDGLHYLDNITRKK